jgi:hypothetical protein
MGKFDDILRDINDFGRYQHVRYFLICLAGLLPPITTYINSFILPFPKFTCNNNLGSRHEHELEKSSVNANHMCHYISNGTVHKCTSWQYDHTFYTSTLTEEVYTSFYLNPI